jgi:hypothetical protein
MGRLLDQLCVTCEESIAQSRSGHTFALLILALLGGWPEIDPQDRREHRDEESAAWSSPS